MSVWPAESSMANSEFNLVNDDISNYSPAINVEKAEITKNTLVCESLNNNM